MSPPNVPQVTAEELLLALTARDALIAGLRAELEQLRAAGPADEHMGRTTAALQPGPSTLLLPLGRTAKRQNGGW